MKSSSLKYLIFKAFIMLMLCVLLSYHLAEASVTLAWQPPSKNTDGTLCSDLAGYKIYYDTDRAGAPYTGRGIQEGDSPITVPLSSLSKTANPEIVLSGLTEDVTYHFSVSAYDKNLNESRRSNNIRALVSSSNTQPVADAGPDQVITQTDLSKGSVQVSLNGSASHDGDGDSLTYSWTQTSGRSVNLMGGSSAAPFFSATSALMGQTLTFQLVVRDRTAVSEPDLVRIFVKDLSSGGNNPPTAQISAAPTAGTVPLSVSFKGTGTDTDGIIKSYAWNFGDGSRATGLNPTHIYRSAGNHRASLTVTDDHGESITAAIQIYVIDPTSGNPSTQPSQGDSQPGNNMTPDPVRDSDGDGIPDFIEWGPGVDPMDSDGDGTPDTLDMDSDNDGEPDSQEGVQDTDGDGASDYIDMDDTDGPLGDQDKDGIDNSTEVTNMMNLNLPDSDGDGLEDGTEFGHLPWPLDSEGDGIIDALDMDSDNDGEPDSREGFRDTDGDGASDYIDIDDSDGPDGDQDQDGILNTQEVAMGLNPNLFDSDQDGIPDPDEVEDIHMPTDTDGDGLINAVDKDSDDDGAYDSEELNYNMDRNRILDRLDATTATFTAKDITMAVKVMNQGGRLSEMKFIPEPFFNEQWKPTARFRYGGLKFRVLDVRKGGSVNIKVIIPRSQRFPKMARYWKYDEISGYQKIRSWVNGNTLTFTIRDGGIGDADLLENSIIDDPGFIGEPEAAVVSEPSPGSSSGGGGSGCRVNRNSSGFPDGLSIFIPMIILLIIKRLKKA